MSARRWSFFVWGEPAPKGSLKAITPPGMKYSVLIDSNAKSVRPWMQTVGQVAQLSQLGRPPHAGPVRLFCVFFFSRPQGHYGSGKNAGKLKPGSPSTCSVKPDQDKLLRAVCDALEGIVYTGDSRVVDGRAQKFYSRPGRPAGVHVTVETFDDLGDIEIPNLQPGEEIVTEKPARQLALEAK